MPRRPLVLILGLALAAPALAQQMPGARFLEVWDLDGDGTATLEEMETQRESVFSMFDGDENGLLDAEEYGYFDEARENDVAGQQGPSAKQMRRLVDAMSLEANDADGDGQVSRDEFIAGTAAWRDLMDRDGDGAITSADFGPGR